MKRDAYEGQWESSVTGRLYPALAVARVLVDGVEPAALGGVGQE